MHGDARPERDLRTIWVAREVDGIDSCARCADSLRPSEVALYTRTDPGNPFDPWCVDCAYTLVRWAGIGAVQAEAFATEASREQMVELIRLGRE